MKKDMKKKLIDAGATVGFVVLIVAVVYAFSWIVTVGIIKLITMCFGWTFKWSVATGIWLIICILQSIFKSNVNVKH